MAESLAEFLAKRRQTFFFFEQKEPPLLISLIPRSNSSYIDFEAFKIGCLLLITYDFYVREQLSEHLSQLIVFFNELIFGMPSCGLMLVAFCALINYNLELSVIPVCGHAWRRNWLLFLVQTTLFVLIVKKNQVLFREVSRLCTPITLNHYEIRLRFCLLSKKSLEIPFRQREVLTLWWDFV